MHKGYNSGVRADGMGMIASAREDASKWASGLLANPEGFIILDTETTGFESFDEIIQVGIVDGLGNVLMDNQMIKPTCSIGPGAILVHGITDEMVKDSPSFVEIFPTIASLAAHKKVVIFNSTYDVRMIQQSMNAHGFEQDYLEGGFDTECAMIQYSRFVGDWNERRGQFKWKKLPGGDHSAVGDCLAVLDLIKRMADQR